MLLLHSNCAGFQKSINHCDSMTVDIHQLPKMIENFAEAIETLKIFKELSSDRSKHSQLLKDKKVILYAATLLDNDNPNILKICLDILENFVSNENTHNDLLSTFGIYEALESLSIKMRKRDEEICRRSTEITDILRNSAPPAYNTRNRGKGNSTIKKHTLYLLYIGDLTNENRSKLERVLIKIKGIISFMIDMDLRRCTLRVCPKLTIKKIIEKIYDICGLKALIITKNKQEGTEVFCDLTEQNILNRSYLEYLEEEYAPTGKAVTATLNFVKNSNGFIKSIVNFWNDSFYW